MKRDANLLINKSFNQPIKAGIWEVFAANAITGSRWQDGFRGIRGIRKVLARAGVKGNNSFHTQGAGEHENVFTRQRQVRREEFSDQYARVTCARHGVRPL